VGSRYTRSRLPVRLVWSSDELTKSAAFREEYQIKRLSKLIKEELVDGGSFKKKSPSEERSSYGQDILHAGLRTYSILSNNSI
jgi:predicted GIY-YIG superfamily endonuclease